MIGIELRKRIVQAYSCGLSGTYEQTAEMFGVGRATVSRLLGRYRKTGKVEALPMGGNYPRQVDLNWLGAHAQQHPDAWLIERIEDWRKESGRRVASSTMSQR